MARAGQTVENPATGERVTFVKTASDTGGELLVLELEWPRPGERAPEHVHPEAEERYEVIEGRAAFRIAGASSEAGPGEVVAVPPGPPHLAWNPTAAPVRLKVEFRPALRWEEFVERLFALTPVTGPPDRRRLAALLREVPREIAPFSR